MLPGPDGGAHVRRAERAVEQAGGQLEVVAMTLDQGEEATRRLGDEGFRHALRQVVGCARRAPLFRITGDRVRGGPFGGGVGQALGVHLVVVDRLSRLSAPPPGVQCFVENRAGSHEDGAGRIGHRGAI